MCTTHTMLTVLSNLSQSLSSVVHASVGASVFSLFLQACWFGDESSKRALVKFDLGRVSLASGADTSAALPSAETPWWQEPGQQNRVALDSQRPWGRSRLQHVVSWHCSGSCLISTCPQHCGCLLLRQPDALMEERNWQGEAPQEPVSREPSRCSGAAFLVEEAGGEQGCWARHVRAVSLFNYRLK